MKRLSITDRPLFLMQATNLGDKTTESAVVVPELSRKRWEGSHRNTSLALHGVGVDELRATEENYFITSESSRVAPFQVRQSFRRQDETIASIISKTCAKKRPLSVSYWK